MTEDFAQIIWKAKIYLREFCLHSCVRGRGLVDGLFVYDKTGKLGHFGLHGDVSKFNWSPSLGNRSCWSASTFVMHESMKPGWSGLVKSGWLLVRRG